jgi:hypothetical protein
MPEHEPAPGDQHAAAAQAERRAFVRVATDLDATCRPAGPMRDQGWPGQLRDISRGGLGLLLRHSFRPGSELTVELRERGGEVRRIVSVRVIHATAVLVEGNYRWLLGCAFEQPLSEEEFQALR